MKEDKEKKVKKLEEKEFVEVLGFTKERNWGKFGKIEITPALKKKFREPFIIKYKQTILKEN